VADAARTQSIRRRVYELLEPGSSDWAARTVDLVLIGLIVVNVAAVILESIPPLEAAFGSLFLVIEIVAVIVFTAEYVLRLWSATEHAPLSELTPWRARLRFALQPQSLIDLFAIAPVYVSLFIAGDLRAFLVLRLFRFFKLARYSPGIASLAEAVYNERRALLASVVILMGTMLIAASLMNIAEGHAQPDKFGTIPAALYWAALTLTTVGYGDVVPVTATGRLLAGVTAFVGWIMLALPVGIVASAFAHEIRRVHVSDRRRRGRDRAAGPARGAGARPFLRRDRRPAEIPAQRDGAGAQPCQAARPRLGRSSPPHGSKSAHGRAHPQSGRGAGRPRGAGREGRHRARGAGAGGGRPAAAVMNGNPSRGCR
jgi:voltage-gated potassium channel Kch